MTNLIKFSKENIFNYFDFVLTTLFFNFNNGLTVLKNIIFNY
ncbi:hypothetical protein [Parvimonas micra]|uniref:Uncharacterized protein n=1 Tax=Parvimonas micra ATCC 33270 TaxID=411465 RepID=A8SKU8_9FIRM|nr:hypothetical protein [Parvimonas micra]EDP24203.1 hypothetical protein PEPMIC_00783 [Parvimonas micra ATCC 33270]VEH97032.1 Uncharacterised protein [Parvimonas micra]